MFSQLCSTPTTLHPDPPPPPSTFIVLAICCWPCRLSNQLPPPALCSRRLLCAPLPSSAFWLGLRTMSSSAPSLPDHRGLAESLPQRPQLVAGGPSQEVLYPHPSRARPTPPGLAWKWKQLSSVLMLFPNVVQTFVNSPFIKLCQFPNFDCAICFLLGLQLSQTIYY